MRTFLIGCLATLVLVAGCAQKQPVVSSCAERDTGDRMVKRAVTLFDSKSPHYNPDKGRALLERSLNSGKFKSLDLPAPFLLTLLRSEKTARKKHKALEERMNTLKEIDLDLEEEEEQTP